MTGTTLLVLTGMGVPPYSARGLTMQIQPIDAATSQRRTINAELVDLSDPAFRKYAATISGNDVQAPALEARWPGVALTVDWIHELAVEGTIEELTETTESGLLFSKPHVPGSIRHESGFTFYRPRLVMLVSGFSSTGDEYGANYNWSLSVEER